MSRISSEQFANFHSQNSDIQCSEKVFDVLVDITQQRDQEQLEQTLVKAIFQYVELVSASFNRIKIVQEKPVMWKTIEVNGSIQDNLTVQSPKLVSIPADIQQAIIQKKSMSFSHGGITRHCFPIFVNGLCVGVFELISAQQMDMAERKLIQGVLEVYHNFLSIIRDNEYDALTGLFNRKTFDEKINRIVNSYQKLDGNADNSVERRDKNEDEKMHWLGVIDIDHFKKVNDTYGHLYGDEVLILVSNIMKTAFRVNDLLFRYGGEEFVVVLAPCSYKDAGPIFERFRKSVEKSEFPQVGHITLSIGYVEFKGSEFPRNIIEKADKALYYAKEHGRNQSCHYADLVPEHQVQSIEMADTEIDLF